MQAKEVWFYSEGSRITGTLNLPSQVNRDLPCIIFGHGYTSYRDEFGGFVRLAGLFCAAGCSVLRIDFRGAGDSTDVNPRGKMLVGSEWPMDVVNAVAFARTLECVDAARVSVLGVSGGGAAVLAAAKYLPDISSVVALAPVSSGHDLLEHLWVGGHGNERWECFLSDVARERRNLILHNVDRFIDVPAALAFPEHDWDVWNSNAAAFPQAARRVTYSSVADLLYRVDSEREIQMCSAIPVLFVHGTADALVVPEGTKTMYDVYRGPKEVMWLGGQPHGFLLETGCERWTQPIVDWVLSQ